MRRVPIFCRVSGLKALMVKAQTKVFQHRMFRSLSPGPFQVLPPLVHCLRKDSCVEMRTLSPSLQSTEERACGSHSAGVHIQMAGQSTSQEASGSCRSLTHPSGGPQCPGAGLRCCQDRPQTWECSDSTAGASRVDQP